MLQKIRIALAVVMWLGITLLFVDFTGIAHAWLGWMAKVQFLPALLALNLWVLAALIIITFVFGRVYCSVICPLGVAQDAVSHVAGRVKKNRFRFSADKNWLRLIMLGVLAGGIITGIGVIVALLEPYGTYGRFAQGVFAPVWAWVNNLLAMAAEHYDSYAFYTRDVWLRSSAVLGVSVAIFLVIMVLAWRNGRTWCNTICPVGTILGNFSRYSFFAPVVDHEKCNHCGLCERNCKASCINSKEGVIDLSRCVDCMDCIDKCRRGAISYTRRLKTAKPEAETEIVATPDPTRRAFMTGAVIAGAAAVAKAAEKTTDGGLAIIEDKKVPERQCAILPPGAISFANFTQRCVACQLCVQACPNDVLRPSTDPVRFMQPEASYERGYCRPECSRCSEVCPTGAISPLPEGGKSAVQVGHAVWVMPNCIPLNDDVECGNCARHCPAGAITMVAKDENDPESVKVPMVNTERCLGCGACENLCPARPLSAIYVEGHKIHRLI